MRRCVCGGIAISGSSIANITLDLRSAMKVRSENTIELMTPDPRRQHGTGVFERSEEPNSVIERRRLSRVNADGYRRNVRSSSDRPTNRRARLSTSSRIARAGVWRQSPDPDPPLPQASAPTWRSDHRP